LMGSSISVHVPECARCSHISPKISPVCRTISALVTALVAGVVSGCGPGPAGQGPASQAPTRTAGAAADPAPEIVASGLDVPWSVAFLDGPALVSQPRPGGSPAPADD